MNKHRLIPILLTLGAHWLLLVWLSLPPPRVAVPEQIVPIELAVLPAQVTQFKPAKPHPSSRKLPPQPAGWGWASATTDSAPGGIAPPTFNVTADTGNAAQAEIALLPMPEIKPAQSVTTLPPPSASYLLDVTYTKPGVANPYYGSGQILWNQTNGRYTMRLEAFVDMLLAKVTLYNLNSEGSIGETGIRPLTMTEKRRGRPETSTHFNYDAGTISFSANTPAVPLQEGAQDQATVSMQLASIGNADPSQFEPGRQITMQVADSSAAKAFEFVVTDRQDLDTRLGHLSTWHIVRPPRPGSYSSRLEIWVAPELDWLPVQIRNTEANGAVTTQTIRKIINGNNP